MDARVVVLGLALAVAGGAHAQQGFRPPFNVLRPRPANRFRPGPAPNGQRPEVLGAGGFRPMPGQAPPPGPPPDGEPPPPPDGAPPAGNPQWAPPVNNGAPVRRPNAANRLPPPGRPGVEGARHPFPPYPDERPPEERAPDPVFPGDGQDPYRGQARLPPRDIRVAAPPPGDPPPSAAPPAAPPSRAITPERGATAIASAAPAMPSAPRPASAGLPGWLLPLLTLAAVPAVLWAGRAPPRPAEKLSPEALLSPATARMDAGDFAGAIPYLQQLVRGHPDVASRARLLLAQCFLKTGLPEVAIEEVRNLHLGDQPPERLYMVAQSFEQAGDPATARQLFLAILRADVNFRDVAQRVRATSGATPIRPAALSGNVASGPFGALPDRFTGVKFLAQGGMGVVYEARDAELDRRVAIKMLAPAYCADAEFVERFFRESRAMARLTHPNIVAVHDVARGRVPYIVMELLDGRSLRRALSDGGLTQGQRIDVGLGVARALAYAHTCSVVHRDVKPENIFVTADGRAKLLDFGLARLLQGDGDTTRLTLPHVVMGTPSYMAPELQAGAAAGPRTDAYALGKVLRELLTAPATTTAPEPQSPLACSPALAAQIERLCSVDAARRPDSLQDVVAALEAELPRPPIASGTSDLAAFRDLHRTLDEAYTRTLHGLKATLGVYRRCEGNPDKVFRYLLNPEGVLDVSARIEALVAGPLAALPTLPGGGVPDLAALAGEVAAYDWRGLAAEVATLAATGEGPELRAAAVQRLRVLHEAVAGLATRLAAALDAHRVRLGPLVEAAVRGVAGHERVKLAVQGEPALAVPAPDRLAADVREVVENLVNNALEAQARQVTVLLAPQATGIELAVTDDGVGIPADRMPDLFEAGRTTKTTGSGTGLARVKLLCGQYGGIARAMSQTGAGTTFTLTFPA